MRHTTMYLYSEGVSQGLDKSKEATAARHYRDQVRGATCTFEPRTIRPQQPHPRDVFSIGNSCTA